MPRVVVESETRTIGKALPAFEREHEIAAPFLRIAELIEGRDPMLWLLEFDALERDDAREWLPLERARAAAPAELADGIDQWLQEQRGTRPEQRALWAQPGWRAEADAWIRVSLPETGRIAVERQWPLASVLRVETPTGTAFFKASFALFRQEAAVTSTGGTLCRSAIAS